MEWSVFIQLIIIITFLCWLSRQMALYLDGEWDHQRAARKRTPKQGVIDMTHPIYGARHSIDIIRMFLDILSNEKDGLTVYDDDDDSYECPSCGAFRNLDNTDRARTPGVQHIAHYDHCKLMEAYKAGHEFLRRFDNIPD